jgi:hypothetical protein
MGQDQRHGDTKRSGVKGRPTQKQSDDDQFHDPDSKILDNEAYLIDGS